jgi:ABC-type transport system substrate-binding protein
MKNQWIVALVLCSAVTLAQSPPQVLKIGIHADIKILNPQKALDSFSLGVLRNVFETLVTFDASSTKVVPALATAWTSDAALRTWTYTIRPNVRFHDGSLLTPEVVVQSFAGVPNFAPRVATLGAEKVVFTLPGPDADFNMLLAQPYYSIVSPRMAQDPALVSGTGPFLYTSWEKGKKVVIRKNPNYWDKAAVLDEVQFLVYPDQAALIRAVQAGQIDLVEYVVGNNLKDLKADPNLAVESIMGNSAGFLSFNTRRAPFSDVRVRRAAIAALNPIELTKRFFSGSAGAPATSVIPPTLFSYFSKTPVNQPEASRALLQQAGWDATKSYVLLESWAPRPYMPDPHGIALEIKKQLAAVGINVQVEQDPDKYFDRLGKGEFDLILNGWIADSAVPADFLASILGTRALGQNNASQWSSPKFDALLDACRTLKDKSLQAKLKEALALVDEEAPMVALFYGPQTVVRSKNVQGYHVHPFSRFKMYSVSLAKP